MNTLKATEGNWLYNGETFAKSIMTAGDISMWREITNEEKESIESQKKELDEETLLLIETLKEELATYDYIGVKIAMGVATKEEYAELIAYTETLRLKINELQQSL